jgi:hypothetical protein
VTQEAALNIVTSPHAGTPIISHSASPTPSNRPSRYWRVLSEESKKRTSRRQSGLICVTNSVGSGNSSSGYCSSRVRAAYPPPRAPSPAFGSPLRAMLGLQRKKKSMRPSTVSDSGQLMPTRRSHLSVHQAEGRSVHWRRRKSKKRQQKVVGNARSVVFAKISR